MQKPVAIKCSLAPAGFETGFALPDQSIRNPKRQRVANKDGKSATDSSHNGFPPRPESQCSRQLLVERNINCADQADHEQADLAEPFPQSQSDISELHRHNFPGKRHPEWRPPDHWTAANRVVQCVRVIDQPRISRKLSEADNDSK